MKTNRMTKEFAKILIRNYMAAIKAKVTEDQMERESGLPVREMVTEARELLGK